ncbi:hypothetical protein SRHO_G00268240 [Serrasalmus rhombeus]
MAAGLPASGCFHTGSGQLAPLACLKSSCAPWNWTRLARHANHGLEQQKRCPERQAAVLASMVECECTPDRDGEAGACEEPHHEDLKPLEVLLMAGGIHHHMPKPLPAHVDVDWTVEGTWSLWRTCSVHPD